MNFVVKYKDETYRISLETDQVTKNVPTSTGRQIRIQKLNLAHKTLIMGFYETFELIFDRYK